MEKLNLKMINNIISKCLFNKEITYKTLLDCTDKSKLEPYIKLINNTLKDFNLKFVFVSKTNEYIILSDSNNGINIVITNYYLELLYNN